ncbi:DNA polymerase III subunit beta [Bacillus suaedaesalsae]|uniref:Beta sliding clamp n=1 Tax=Bacillus suaedaesalsae TaxID=2810349 RepID=A0ABS2DHP5_9BACI|nr:DNA polymerase III subunit beta [Bacillus suaedaesalsae]MBM6618005.1 DNA polymerase III subunit beta [Bacillus suaedaesalsae]
MEFKINNDYFNKAISDVSKAVSTKTTVPLLSGIKIIAQPDRITVVGSNGDIAIERTLPLIGEGNKMIEVYSPGRVVVSAKYISDIIKKLPYDIYIKVSDNQSVTIKSGDITTKLNGIDGSDFPELPKFDVHHSITMSSEDLIGIIKDTVFATSKNETRPVLTGVNFTFEEDVLTCVATNSHRLALRKYRMKSPLRGSFIVPSSSLIELSKLFGGHKANLEIYTSENNIMFKSNNLSFYSRLIDGTYPNVAGLIPEDTSTILTLDTRELLKGIDRASLFASEWKNNNIVFQITDESKIRISSNSSEMGQIEEIQHVKTISGAKDLTISLDGNFMMDALKAIRDEEVKLCFNGTMRPILILPVGNDTQLQLISPVRS